MDAKLALAAISMAADLLGKKEEKDKFNADKLGMIQQQHMAQLGNLYSHGKTGTRGGDYSIALARPPERGDNGLGAAIQLAGGILGGKPADEESKPASEPSAVVQSLVKPSEGTGSRIGDTMGAIDALGANTNKLEAPLLISDDTRPTYERSLTLIGPTPRADDDDDELTNRLSRRFSL